MSNRAGFLLGFLPPRLEFNSLWYINLLTILWFSYAHIPACTSHAVKQAKNMIHNEMENWTKYDMYFDQERSRPPRWLDWLSAKVKGKNTLQRNFSSWAHLLGPMSPNRRTKNSKQKWTKVGPKRLTKVSNVVLFFPAARAHQRPTGPGTQVPVPTDLSQIKKAHTMASSKRYPENHLGPIQIAQ